MSGPRRTVSATPAPPARRARGRPSRPGSRAPPARAPLPRPGRRRPPTPRRAAVGAIAARRRLLVPAAPPRHFAAPPPPGLHRVGARLPAAQRRPGELRPPCPKSGDTPLRSGEQCFSGEPRSPCPGSGSEIRFGLTFSRNPSSYCHVHRVVTLHP